MMWPFSVWVIDNDETNEEDEIITINDGRGPLLGGSMLIRYCFILMMIRTVAWRYYMLTSWQCHDDGDGDGDAGKGEGNRRYCMLTGWQWWLMVGKGEKGRSAKGKCDLTAICHRAISTYMRYALYAMYSVVIFHIQYCKIQYCNIRYAIVELVGSHNILNDLQVFHWNCTETDLTFCNCSKGGKCNDILECIEYEYVLDRTIWQKMIIISTFLGLQLGWSQPLG